MAVTEVSLLFTSRGGKDTLDNRRTYTRMYEVLTDSATDDEQTVGNAGGIPLPGERLDTDAGAVVVDMDFQQSDDSPFIWYVTANYDSTPPAHEKTKQDDKVGLDGGTIDKTGPSDNPLDEPAVWTLTFEDSEEPAVDGVAVDEAGNLVITTAAPWAVNQPYTKGEYLTANNNVYLCTTGGTSAAAGTGPAGTDTGIVDNSCVWTFFATFAQTQADPNYAIRKPILNSADLPFDPPPMVDVSRLVLSVTKNAAIATVDYLLKLKNAVNVIAWRGVPARCAKVKKVEHDGGKSRNNIQYITTKWEILLDPDTFDIRILDAGFYEKVSTPVVGLREILDVGDQPITSPVPLDGSGRRLPAGKTPVFLRYVPRQQKLVDFNQLLPF